MKNIYTWAANPAKRTVTVGDIIEAKGKKILTQVTANNSLEAKAYTNLKKMKDEIEIERVKALKAFIKDSLDGKFPGPENSVNVSEEILENFKKKL